MTGPVQPRPRGCTGYVSILWFGLPIVPEIAPQHGMANYKDGKCQICGQPHESVLDLINSLRRAELQIGRLCPLPTGAAYISLG